MAVNKIKDEIGDLHDQIHGMPDGPEKDAAIKELEKLVLSQNKMEIQEEKLREMVLTLLIIISSSLKLNHIHQELPLF